MPFSKCSRLIASNLFVPLFFLAAFCCSPSWGAYVKAPEEVKGEAGAFIQIKAESDGKIVRWLVLDKGLNLFPTDLLKDSKTAVVYAANPGRYRILAYTAVGDEPSEPVVCTIVIGGGGPSPQPNPSPSPQPAPPSLTPFQNAYSKETDPGKKEWTLKLAALYRQFAQTLDSGKGGFTTWGELHAAMNAAAKNMGVSGKVLLVQQAVQDELKTRLPSSSSAPFDASSRTLASLSFTYIARSLEDAVLQ